MFVINSLKTRLYFWNKCKSYTIYDFFTSLNETLFYTYFDVSVIIEVMENDIQNFMVQSIKQGNQTNVGIKEESELPNLKDGSNSNFLFASSAIQIR